MVLIIIVSSALGAQSAYLDESGGGFFVSINATSYTIGLGVSIDGRLDIHGLASRVGIFNRELIFAEVGAEYSIVKDPLQFAVYGGIGGFFELALLGLSASAFGEFGLRLAYKVDISEAVWLLPRLSTATVSVADIHETIAIQSGVGTTLAVRLSESFVFTSGVLATLGGVAVGLQVSAGLYGTW